MNCDASVQLPFFVYGTLIPGQPNDHLWGNAIVSAESAILANCQLFDMDYYPMLVEQCGSSVRGKLITVKEDAYLETLTRIDALEGFVPNRPARSRRFAAPSRRE